MGRAGFLKKFFRYSPVWLLLILGLWLVILLPMGSHLPRVPGDLGDARFNAYVLEHFYQWASGVTRAYWNATFFYPFVGTINFSDNLLGAAPFYASLRWIGFDIASAFQGWYILGSLLNFVAAGYVLWRLQLKPLAIGVGSFFFAFGLPLLAQENHAQLIYHFCIPLASYALWRFYKLPRLRYLVFLVAFCVWQFYLSIYLGIFLFFLVAVLFITLPVFADAGSFGQRLLIWPKRLLTSITNTSIVELILAPVFIAALGVGLVDLLRPYAQISKLYGFTRTWDQVFPLLPRLQSYLLADNSMLWKSFSNFFQDLPLRWEHQLFPGAAVIIFLLLGIVMHFRTENSRIAWQHFCAAAILIVLTLEVNGFTIYKLIWQLPGMDSLRSVTRIMLVIMWPLALFIAWTVDGLFQRFNQHPRWRLIAVYLAASLLVAESVFYLHATYSKEAAQARLDSLLEQLPGAIPADPILFVARDPQEQFWAKEIDAMLVSQQLGWPTLNGYSGNYPPGYAPADSCAQLPQRIEAYMGFAQITDPIFYLGTIRRVVTIGFSDCDPAWWENMP